MRIVLTPGRFFSAAAAYVGFTLLLQSITLPAHQLSTTAVSTSSSSSLSGLATAIQRHASAAVAALPTTTTMKNSGRSLLFGNKKMELSPIENARSLQTMTGDVCAPADAFADDDDSLLRFSSNFQPTCNCLSNNPFDVEGYLEENPLPEDLSLLQNWIDNFNTFGSNILSDEQVGCINKCSVCVSTESPCLILEEQQRNKLRASLNITLEEFLAFADLSDDAAGDFFLAQLTVFTQEITGTSCYMAAGSSSKVCLTESANYSSEEGIAGTEVVDLLMFSCSMSVDGTDCTSCSFDQTTGCATVDCANIGGGSSASLTFSCGGEDRASYPGVYGPLYDLTVLDKVTYTLGTCDGSSPTAPSLPVATPVTSPVATPVTSPAATPVSSPVALTPVASPPVASPPVALTPVASPPVALTPVLAPVPRAAPVSSPLPPVPPASLNSGVVTAYGGVVGQLVPMLVVASGLAAFVMGL